MDGSTGASGAAKAAAPLVGDGGASWRLKALKRAQERAAAGGRELDEEVRDRHASVGALAGSIAGSDVAASHAHLQAARARKGSSDTARGGRGPRRERSSLDPGPGPEARMRRARDPDARAFVRRPADAGRGSAGAGRGRELSRDDAAVLASAHASMNKFASDGSFARDFAAQEADAAAGSAAADAVPEAVPPAAAPTEPAQPLTGNFGAAAALRARLTGKAPPPAAAEAPRVLLSVDAQGRALAGAHGREAPGERTAPGNAGKRKLQRFEGGAKVRHFRDDDQADLEALVAAARHGDALHDLDAALAGNIAKKARYRGTELHVDDEYDVDGGLEMYEDRARKGTREQQQERAERAVRSETKRYSTALDRCSLCFASTARRSELTLSVAQHVYMALPAKGRLVAGHCVLAPVEHAPSFRDVDDHVFEELKNYKKCLIRMFEAQGQKCVFLETAMRVKEMGTHACVECIPMDDRAFANAPLVFKQEVGEAESEWSQHHAKRLMDTSAKGLRGCIPTRFPYFHVEFGYRTGFVHIIDDESKWKASFGRSVMVGLMRLREEEMHRRAMAEGARAQAQYKADFLAQWKEHDWTDQLE